MYKREAKVSAYAAEKINCKAGNRMCFARVHNFFFLYLRRRTRCLFRDISMGRCETRRGEAAIVRGKLIYRAQGR